MKPESVKQLREITNCGLIEAKKALELFDENIAQSVEYLKIKGLAVCRRRPDGSIWQTEDYVNYVKSYVKESSTDCEKTMYWDIHVTYGERDGDGYSVFLKTSTSFDANEAVQEAIDKCMFQEPEDLGNIDYVDEMTKEEYEEVVN